MVTPELLQQDVTPTQHTNISITINVMNAVVGVSRMNKSSCQRMFGCAMGSPVSTTVANLVIELE